MVQFDAFAGGIDIGGLRNMLDIKVLICYTLSSVDMPITRNQLCDSLQQTGMVNYFDANIAIDGLLETGSILEEKNGLVVSPKGRSSARQLEGTLLPGVRERVVKATLNIAKRARSERENNVRIVQVENGYDLIIEIESQGVRYFSLTLNLPDVLQAEHLKERFLNNPDKLYGLVIDSLLEE